MMAKWIILVMVGCASVAMVAAGIFVLLEWMMPPLPAEWPAHATRGLLGLALLALFLPLLLRVVRLLRVWCEGRRDSGPTRDSNRWLFMVPVAVIVVFWLRVPGVAFLIRVVLPSVVMALICHSFVPRAFARICSLILVPSAIALVAVAMREAGTNVWGGAEAVTIPFLLVVYSPVWVTCALCLDPRAFRIERLPPNP